MKDVCITVSNRAFHRLLPKYQNSAINIKGHLRIIKEQQTSLGTLELGLLPMLSGRGWIVTIKCRLSWYHKKQFYFCCLIILHEMGHVKTRLELIHVSRWFVICIICFFLRTWSSGTYLMWYRNTLIIKQSTYIRSHYDHIYRPISCSSRAR